ncbi:MAG: hypothetical protein JWL77_4049 [Chthonomonadaceae bacterium]|nr:hypothetical protein [Chthonomonadaceae bacterium]
MGDHDFYGKAVMRQAVGSAFRDTGAEVRTTYGEKGGARIDGVIGDTIAVEIESRVSKQVRGAVLDLICHAYPKKLLVLLPVHQDNTKLCANQCLHILEKFVKPEECRVVILTGSGRDDRLEADVACIRAVLQELGFPAHPV